MRRISLARSPTLLSRQRAGRRCYREHLIRCELGGQRVLHPVDGVTGLPGDEPRVLALVVNGISASADAPRDVRSLQNRWALPGEPLDAPVLAHVVRLEDDSVGGELLEAGGAQQIRPRRADGTAAV